MTQEKDLAAEKSMAAIAACANHLMQTKPAFVQVVASMLAARQLYTASMYELDLLIRSLDINKEQSKFEAEQIEWNENHKVALKEILINASVAKTYESFDSNTLLKGLIETVLPWLKKVTLHHTQVQTEEKQKENAEKEEKRINTEIDIGFSLHDKANNEIKLNRQNSLLFIGESKVVRWLLNKVTKNLLEFGSGSNQLVRLTLGDSTITDPSLASLSEKVWENCAAVNASFQQLYASSIFPQLKNPVDALIVDDISVAFTGLSFSPLLTRANEAQHKLKKWTKTAGALLISGLPLQRELKPNELHLPDYESLRMHNLLRAVVAEPVQVDGVDSFKITVGLNEIATIPAIELAP
jgi:hypothetical protein